jgi:hypothetical protein
MMQNREQYYRDERYIHDLSVEKILAILQADAWAGTQQAITSAETNNDNQPLPNLDAIAKGNNTAGVDAFFDIAFHQDVTRVLDVGGGKYDVCRSYMQTRGIELLVYDPFNRTHEHNQRIKLLIEADKAAAATSMSVLNVIAEPEARLLHISLLKSALITGGHAYFKVWPGEGTLRGSYRPTLNSYGHPGFQANAFACRFLREVQLVFGVDQVKLHETIPNLIVAAKMSTAPAAREEIATIQELSKQDEWFVSKTGCSVSYGLSFFDVNNKGHAASAEKPSSLLKSEVLN